MYHISIIFVLKKERNICIIFLSYLFWKKRRKNIYFGKKYHICFDERNKVKTNQTFRRCQNWKTNIFQFSKKSSGIFVSYLYHICFEKRRKNIYFVKNILLVLMKENKRDQPNFSTMSKLKTNIFQFSKKSPGIFVSYLFWKRRKNIYFVKKYHIFLMKENKRKTNQTFQRCRNYHLSKESWYCGSTQV